MSYTVTIYKAEFASIDTNVVQEYKALKDAGFSVCEDRRLRFDMEHMHEYGTSAKIRKKVYNFYKIMKDYSLGSMPRVVSVTEDTVIFTDNDTVIEIDKETVKQEYVADRIVDAQVVAMEIQYLFDNSEEMFCELRDLIEENIKAGIHETSCFAMTFDMVSIVRRYAPYVRLYDFFEYGKSPLYISLKS